MISVMNLKWYWKQECLKQVDFATLVSEYHQEMPQSHTADQLTAPRERATEHLLSQDVGKRVKVKQSALSSLSR